MHTKYNVIMTGLNVHVEDVDVVLSLFIVALLHDVLPASNQVAVDHRLVVVGQVSFHVQVLLPQLQYYAYQSK